LCDTSTDTAQHSRSSGAQIESFGRILVDLGRGENQDGTLGWSFNPCLLDQLAGNIDQSLTHGIKPW
jgi:hypothetical protein